MRICILLVAAFLYPVAVAWNVSDKARRSFLSKTLATSAVFTIGLQSPAVAYERRDVGGPDRSPETAVFNEQAYITNNRLEKGGFKLETAQEQSAALTAALSDYAYDATTSKSKTNKKAVSSTGKKQK